MKQNLNSSTDTQLTTSAVGFGNTLLCPVLSISELQIGETCILRSKHPMNLEGDYIFKGDYKVILKEETGAKLWPYKLTFKHTKTGKEYRLMNVSDGYYEVVSKYRA